MSGLGYRPRATWALGLMLAWVMVGALACGDDGGSGDGGSTSTNSGTTSTNSGTTSTNSGTTSTNSGTTSTNNASTGDVGVDDGGTDADDGDTGVEDVAPDTPDDTGGGDVEDDAWNGPLSVVSALPEDGSVDVPISTALQVVFDGPVDPDSLSLDTIRISPPIGGAVFWDAEALTATIRPNAFLLEETAYTVTVTDGVTAAGGAPLSEPFAFGFTTSDTTLQPGDTTVYTANGYTATVLIDDPEAALRSYVLESNAPMRDGLPADGRATFQEQAGQLVLRSGNAMFDALFALAVSEVRDNSVSQISDGAFNQGQGVPCDCFETGAKWNYVWTRDTAYAVDLGLALVEPGRSRRSLDFKLSERKGGGDLQIVQDTGSGGSYPVSTDRVVWSIGAWEALKFLDGSDRAAFEDRTYTAMVNTGRQDRRMVYDPSDGLYRGEQSFLDWREQSYPSWTAQDTVHLGMSKSLSTNVGHYVLLARTAELAEARGDAEVAAEFGQWADDLREAIRRELWLEESGMFSALKTTTLDPAPLHKFELLGLSLAVLYGVATEEQAAQAVANYPHSAMGPPVLWPQQPLIPIYHNRGLWPFVTAYGLLAAREVGNDAVFNHDFESLIRGAALNVSHMENFEFLSHLPWVDDGAASGPVVNSQRQLWSVAGYVGAVVKGLFGVEASQEGLQINPFVTAHLRNTWFQYTDQVTLSDVAYRGVRFDIRLELPPAQEGAVGGAYRVASVRVEGDDTELLGQTLEPGRLSDGDVVVVVLVDQGSEAAPITLVDNPSDFRNVFAPREPNLTEIVVNGDDRLELAFDSSGESGVVFHVYRDGEEVAEGLEGGTWVDPDSGDWRTQTHCYAIESVFTSSGHRSHHSPPRCFWGRPDGSGPEADRITQMSIYNARVTGGGWGETAGLKHYTDWGDPEDAIEYQTLVPRWSGPSLLQLQYGNGSGGITTGITAAVKWVSVEDVERGELVSEGMVMMPQLGTWERWADSSFLPVDLEAGRVYRVRIEDSVNMSYFAHFIPYNGPNGGGDAVYNKVNVASLRVLPMSGEGLVRDTGNAVALSGAGDLAQYPDGTVLSAGIPFDDSDTPRVAMAWDDDYLYLTFATSAFGEDYVPFHLYMQAGEGDLGAPSAGEGVEYSNLTPNLPFAPTHLISTRWLSDDGSPSGPWGGVWAPSGDAWSPQMRFEPGVTRWAGAGRDMISLRVPRAALGSPSRLRIAGHAVNGVPANEWKAVLPESHTPWQPSAAGYIEVDLTQAPGAGAFQTP